MVLSENWVSKIHCLIIIFHITMDIYSFQRTAHFQTDDKQRCHLITAGHTCILYIYMYMYPSYIGHIYKYSMMFKHIYLIYQTMSYIYIYIYLRYNVYIWDIMYIYIYAGLHHCFGPWSAHLSSSPVGSETLVASTSWGTHWQWNISIYNIIIIVVYW